MAHAFSPRPDAGVIAITGASDGLGRALALAWARPGARMVLSARRQGPLDDVAREARTLGAVVCPLRGDVASPGFALELQEAATGLFGPVTHLVTNASSLGPVPLVPIADTTDEAWEEAVQTNLLGTARLWRQVLPVMESALGGGRLLAISSDAAQAAYPHWGAYGATKAAVDHLVRILAAEFAEHRVPNVFVYAVDPGDMATALHRAAVPGADEGDLARPEDVAPHLVALLAREIALPSGRYTLESLKRALGGRGCR